MLEIKGQYDILLLTPISMTMENQFAVGVIGVGNMGSALVRGIVNKSSIEAKSIIICDVDKVQVETLCRDLGVVDGVDANNTSKLADLVILASKPQNMSTLLKQISKSIKSNQTVMSIAAGITTNSIESVLFGDIPIVRIMHNHPDVVE